MMGGEQQDNTEDAESAGATKLQATHGEDRLTIEQQRSTLSGCVRSQQAYIEVHAHEEPIRASLGPPE